MDWDIRIGDTIRTDRSDGGISRYGVITGFDEPLDDGDIFACFAAHEHMVTGETLTMYNLISNITHNLSADARDERFHSSIAALTVL